MACVAPTLLAIALLGAPPRTETHTDSPGAIRCARAIDELVCEVYTIANAWEESGRFRGWCASKWTSKDEADLAQLLDRHSDWFTAIDAILIDPSLGEAVPLTERVRDHRSPSLMETRYLCNILCAHSVISVRRGDSTDAAHQLEQAVHLGLVMNAESSIGRMILAALSYIWKDTLEVLLEDPSFDPVAARTVLDARLASIAQELDADVDRLDELARREMLAMFSEEGRPEAEPDASEARSVAAFASICTQHVLARAALMRSALAVSAYRRERGVWPESIRAAYAAMDGAPEVTPVPGVFTFLRRTTSGVCILAVEETCQPGRVLRPSIRLSEL